MERLSDSLIFSLRLLRNVRYWLLAITAGCIAIHITLVWRTDNSSLLGTSLLFWGGVASLLWGKRHSLKLESSWTSSLFGFFILGLVLLKSLSITGGYFLRIAPFALGISLILLASGFRGFRQFWQELTLTFFLGGHEVLLDSSIDLSELTARFSTLLLWSLGFNVHRQGVNIYLPGGGVGVYDGCSGLTLIAQLVGIAVLFLITVPTHWRLIKGLMVVLFSVGLAFFMNGIRVALMAVLVASGDPDTFDYWHVGQGSLLFALLAVFLFLGICWSLTGQMAANS